ILLRQKQKKLIMLPSETMIWQPEFTDKTLSRKPGAVQNLNSSSLLPPVNPGYPSQNLLLKMALTPICCSNGDNNGARESCYYLLQRAPSYFL
ncbi:hypothetical protein OFP61_22725, partial [Escherichia coli]|nr:hypothetical protein [Escherichia coli]